MTYTLTDIYKDSLQRGSEFMLPLDTYVDNQYLKDIKFVSASKKLNTLNDIPKPMQRPMLYKYLMSISLLTDLTNEFTNHIHSLETPIKMFAVFFKSIKVSPEESLNHIRPVLEEIVNSTEVKLDDVNRLLTIQQFINTLNKIIEANEGALGDEALFELDKFLDAYKYSHDSPTAQADLKESGDKLKDIIPGVQETVEGRTSQDALNALRGIETASKNRTSYVKEEPVQTTVKNKEDDSQSMFDNVVEGPLLKSLSNGSQKNDKPKENLPEVIVPGKEDADLETHVSKVVESTPPPVQESLADRKVKPLTAGSTVSFKEYNDLLLQITALQAEKAELLSKLNDEAINATLLEDMKITSSRLEQERAILENQLKSSMNQLQKSKDRMTSMKGYVSPEEVAKYKEMIKAEQEKVKELQEFIKNAKVKYKELKEANHYLDAEVQSLRNEMANTPETSAWVHAQRAMRRVFRKLGNYDNSK